MWFNIGVKGEPQQASACQPYDALSARPRAWCPSASWSRQDAVGAKVFDAHGLTRVVAVKANGRKPVLRIHTKAGYSSTSPPTTSCGGRAATSPVGSCRPASSARATSSSGTAPSLTARARSPEQAVAEAALAGWLQADGFVGQYEGTNRSLTIEAMTVTRRREGVGPRRHRHGASRTCTATSGAVATVEPSLDCRRTAARTERRSPDFVQRWDLMTRGVDMRVPEHLFTAPLPVVAAYLRSLFQAEGYVSVRPPSALDRPGHGLRSSSCGASSPCCFASGSSPGSRFAADAPCRPARAAWVLNIRTAGDRRRFADEIGFVDPVKAAKLEPSLELPGAGGPAARSVLEIDRIEVLGEMDVYDIQTESGEYLSGNLRVHNCFILAVEDTMRSILNWYVEEGIIFKGGSGSGINLSNIRSSYEHLKGGGTASGPVSFMRGADASAGTIKSGGKTRRAAKMVILNADHPDVEDFIWCKAVEERKARVLRDAGFDMDLDGKDSHSTQYQNANNSVRVTDEFMQAVVDDADWHLRAVTTGETVRTRQGPRPVPPDRRGGVGVRRPRHAVRHHHQPLAHGVQHRPHQRVQPLLVSTCTSTTRRATWPAST